MDMNDNGSCTPLDARIHRHSRPHKRGRRTNYRASCIIECSADMAHALVVGLRWQKWPSEHEEDNFSLVEVDLQMSSQKSDKLQPRLIPPLLANNRDKGPILHRLILNIVMMKPAR